MTLFSLYRAASGLSQKEAAAFLGSSISAVQKWERGERNCPPDAVDAIRNLVIDVTNTADKVVAAFHRESNRHGKPEVARLGICTDDHEAGSVGFPTASAHSMAIALAAARISKECDVIVEPRGSSVPTAAAADLHDGVF